MKQFHPCPECGKPMSEQEQWHGVWTCPDYKKPTNNAPPYRYKCHGMEIEKQGSDLFLQEISRIIAERN